MGKEKTKKKKTQKKEIVVMKFGGTSVADPEKILTIAAHIAKVAKSKQVAVIISAMGKSTDNIIDLMQSVNCNPPEREMAAAMATGEALSAAVMAAALNDSDLGCKAKSMTSYQMRLLARGTHTRGKIVDIQGIEEMKAELSKEIVLICAGFQGIDADGNIITLYRGGSDTSAVALAHKLGAELCEIYTDVDGVFTVDPRVVPDAKRLDFITFGGMLQMSAAGAGVLVDRAVQLARDLNVALRVLRSPSKGTSDGGTLVSHRDNRESGIEVNLGGQLGIAIRKNISLISVDLINKPGKLADFLEAMSNFIIGDWCHAKNNDKTHFSIWVDTDDLSEIKQRLYGWEVKVDSSVVCLTLAGPAVKEGKAYGARFARVLAKANVNVEMTSTANDSIMAIVSKKHLKKAAKALAVEFDLCN